jgi:hypothetical protein
LQVGLVRVKLELERYKKWYYGPRADHLRTAGELAQLLLYFEEELDHEPIKADDLPRAGEPIEELRRVTRRKGQRNLGNFENLLVATHVYELNEAELACPCCGLTREEIGADESWQIEYLPGHSERIHHVRKTMPARAARRTARTRASQRRRSRRRRSIRVWPAQACWPTS